MRYSAIDSAQALEWKFYHLRIIYPQNVKSAGKDKKSSAPVAALFLYPYSQNDGATPDRMVMLPLTECTQKVQTFTWDTLYAMLVPASTRSSRYCLRSSDSNQFVVPPVKLSTYGRRAFSVSGPVVWNSLPDYLRDHTLSHDSFRRYPKTYFFARY